MLASNRSTLIGLNFQNDDRYQAIRDDQEARLYISPPFVTPTACSPSPRARP